MIAATAAMTAETIAAMFRPPEKAACAAAISCSPSASGNSAAVARAPSILSEAAAAASGVSPSGREPSIRLR